MSDDVLIKVENVSKKFCRSLKKSLWYGVQDVAHELNPFARQTAEKNCNLDDSVLRKDEFWAVNDVSFELRRGECLGLIGRNGAGKTTLLRMLNGLIKPDHGYITIRGRVGALIALGAGFNPILTGRENIYVNASVLGLTRREIDEKISEIIDFAEIGKFIDAPVQSYSSGMQVRLGFAVATALEPDVLLLDEVLAVGDANFKSKCYNRIGTLLMKTAVIFVTHSMHQVYRICNSVITMDKSRVILAGKPHEAIRVYDTLCIQPACVANIFMDKRIQSFKVDLPSEGVVCPGRLLLRLLIVPRETLWVGLVIVNLTAISGEILAAERRQHYSRRELSAGKESCIELSLGPLMLRTGFYRIACAVYNQDGKQNLAHAIDLGPLEIINNVGTEAITTI